MLLPVRIPLPCFAMVALLLISPSVLPANTTDGEMDAADAELNTAYQKALAAMPDPVTKENLRTSQRAWITYRDAEVAFYIGLGTGRRGMENTATELTQERTKRLRGIVQDAHHGTVQ